MEGVNEIKDTLPADAKPFAMGGAYEAADRAQRSLMTWNPLTRSVDADVLPAKGVANARAQDLLRNDAFIAAGQNLHKDGIVGRRYHLSAKPDAKALGMDSVAEGEFQEEVEAKFTAWAESVNNWPDAAGKSTFTQIIRMGVGECLATGEVLAAVEWMRDASRPYHTAVQMIDSSRLSDPGDRLFDRDRIKGGVEFNKHGAPQAYYIRKSLPGDHFSAENSYQWTRVSAKNRIGRPQIIHIVEQTRPGQTRGISQLVAVLKETRCLRKFREISLQRAAVLASYAMAIQTDLPPQAAFETLGGGDVGDQVAKYASKYLGTAHEYQGDSRNMMVDGVKIPHLLPGSELKVLPLGNPGEVGAEFETSLLRYIAANLGVSYEQLSKDFTQTNYSSARAGMAETRKSMLSRKSMVADRFASMIYRLWFEEALNRGDITTLPRNAPNFYEGLNMEAYLRCEWIGAGEEWIDPLKEAQAGVLRLEKGLTTYAIELARQGHDWEAVLRQRAREQRVMKQLGIVTEQSPAMNSVEGKPGAVEADAPDDPDTQGTEDD